MHWISDEVHSGYVDIHSKKRIIDNFESTDEFQGLSEDTKLYWSVMKDEMGENDQAPSTKPLSPEHLERYI
jgi:hypothetical protein